MDRHRGDRDRSWDRDRDRDRDRERDRDRDRDRDRYGGDAHFQPYRRPSRFSDGPPSNSYQRSPGNFRTGFSPAGGGGGGHRSFDSPPRHPHGVGGGGGDGGGGGGGFRPTGSGGGFRPTIAGGFGGNFQSPLSGQKRGSPFSGRAGASPEHSEGRNFVKLFVGSVPKTATEEDIRPLFEEHGKVIEVALIKDRRTGQQQDLLHLVATYLCAAP